MRVVRGAFWVLLALCGAVAYGVITRVIRPSEQVNALWLVVAAACTFILAYRFYGSFLASKVFALDDRRATPAIRLADGHDFDATNRWVLFGHHFAAIAGAGPRITAGRRHQRPATPGTGNDPHPYRSKAKK